MNGKDLFQAMGFVEDRFIQEAEMGHLPVAQWGIFRRIMAAAACVCLVTVAGAWWMSQNMGRSAAPPEPSEVPPERSEAQVERPGQTAEWDPKSWLYGFRVIRADGQLTQKGDGEPLVIRSREEWMAYWRSMEQDTESGWGSEEFSTAHQGFQDAEARYDEAFFRQRDLILLTLEESSGSIQHEVQSIRPYGGGWLLQVRSIVPEVGTCDMAQWLILVEVEKDLIDQGETIALERTD